jgi:transposase
LALVVPPADEQDRTQVGQLAAALQDATGATVELASVDQGDTGEEPAAAAQAHGLQLAVVKLPEAHGPKRGFVLLPRRWVVERHFAWATRFRRLVRDYERLAATLVGLHFLTFACLMLHQFTHLTLNLSPALGGFPPPSYQRDACLHLPQPRMLQWAEWFGANCAMGGGNDIGVYVSGRARWRLGHAASRRGRRLR